MKPTDTQLLDYLQQTKGLEIVPGVTYRFNVTDKTDRHWWKRGQSDDIREAISEARDAEDPRRGGDGS